MESAVGLVAVMKTGVERRRVLLAAGVLATVAATAAAAALGASASSPHADLVAVARGLAVAVPMAVGLVAWHEGLHTRFGLLLLATGAIWFLTTLAESSDELVYTAGRTAGWFAELLLVYVFLAFPSGRLRDRADRLLVGTMALALGVLFLPRLLLASDFLVPVPYTSCVRDCPGNALFALEHEPGIVGAVLEPAGTLAVTAIMLALVARLWQRATTASPLSRHILVPVLAVAMLRATLLTIGLWARVAVPDSVTVETISWLLTLAVPMAALAFLAGLTRWRSFAVRALQQLAGCVRTGPDPRTLRRALAEAFDDASLDLVFPVGPPMGGWTDCRGERVALPRPRSGRRVTDVRVDGKLTAALVHDEALLANPALLEAGSALAAVALDHVRLAAEADTATRELRRSRARIAGSAERERRRIERDLHDGAQQRLVALRIELGLTEDIVRADPDRGIERLQELECEVDEALEDLRSLAHGVYPPLLADRGLAEALRPPAARAPIPVALDVRDVGRYAPEIESAVYFCVLEAIQNAVKHAEGAHRLVVSVDGGRAGGLRFEVRDDGAGGGVQPGAGIANMRERLAAVGGSLRITATPRVGTVVRGRVPPQV